MQAGLVFAVIGDEVEDRIERPTLMARLDRLVSGRRNLTEGWAATLLERAIGGEVWLAVIGTWNAMCAALLADRVPEDVRTALQGPWRQVLGQPLEV